MNDPGMFAAFGVSHSIWLVTGITLLLFATYLHAAGRATLSLILLIAGGFTLRLLMTSTDPFLYEWDEQYHALVAKNLIAHPGTPMLYNEPLFPVDITRWDRNHIWLHKPPLFLWILAVSIKILGAIPLAVKLPSVILGTLMIPALYDLVRRISNERAGWIAAMLFASHSYFIQLVSGFRHTDHNDLFFAAFVLFSFWAWVRYTDRPALFNALVTGVLVACAVLIKWMPGVLVFGSWGLWLLAKSNRSDRLKWLHLIAAFFTVVVIVLPWHLRTFVYFPAEAAYEMKYNMLHFTIAIEGHEGPWYYHFDALRELMGWTMAILILPGLFFLGIADRKQRRSIYIIAAVVFFFVFYSLAETKMPLFMLPLIPLLIAGTAIMFDRLSGKITKNKAVFAIVMIALCVFTIDPIQIIEKHSSYSELGWYRDLMKQDRARAEQIQEECGEGKWVVFNYPDNARASFMFYTGYSAYSEIPDTAFISEAIRKGFKVATMDNINTPETYRNNPGIKLISP